MKPDNTILSADGPAACCESARLAGMFSRIAPKYDLVNHIASLGQDYFWRRRVVRYLDSTKQIALADLATGTGDLLIELLAGRPNIISSAALDLSAEMLALCEKKLAIREFSSRVTLVCGDAANVPFADGSFDVVTIGFGIRNVPDAAKGLREIHRILRPGGQCLVLEFSLPPGPVVRGLYLFYLRYIVVLIGRVISGNADAYRYLNSSVESFYSAKDFRRLMENAGFEDVTAEALSFGVAHIYRGTKC